MTKILLATDSFPYGRGEKSFILPELGRLTKEYDVTVISHADQRQITEGFEDRELPAGVRVITHPRPVLSGIDKLNALFRFLTDRDGRREIREILRGRKHCMARLYQSLSFYAQTLADQRFLKKSNLFSDSRAVIYYAFWYDYYCYSMIREKKRHPHVRIIARTHGRDLYHERVPGGRQPFRAQMEAGLNGIAFACAYGREYYEKCVRNKNFPADMLHVCRLGTEPAACFMPGHEGGAWQLLSCSNVIPLKRIERIVEGLSLIEDLSINWTHLGDGEGLEDVKAYAREKLEGKENIRYIFMGYVGDIDAYYRENQVDCFITVSTTEGGCPVSIQEAMSYGIPVIGTDVGGITEMIAGNGILLCADPDAAEVAAAIRKLCQMDKVAFGKMKERSLSLWREMFSAGECYQKIREVLRG